MIADEASARAYVAGLADSQALDRLQRLASELREENERQNLVAKPTLDRMWARHFADSAQLLRFVSRETPGTWLDVGTGAGFPGLVVAALRPNWPVVLVEPRRKRIDWLRRMVAELALRHCRVAGTRIEALDSFGAGVISARAFAPLPRLLELARRFSTNDTLWLLPKGRSAEQELAMLANKDRKMFHVEHSLTDPQARILVGNRAERT